MQFVPGLRFADAHNLAQAFVFTLLKIFFIIALLALIKTIFARIKINQMIEFGWKYLVPLAFLQILINLIIKEMFLI